MAEILGNPNDLNSKITVANEDKPPEQVFYDSQDAAHKGGYTVRVLTQTLDKDSHLVSKTQDFHFDTKKEQEDGADFYSAWLYQDTVKRTSLDGGALVVIEGVIGTSAST